MSASLRVRTTLAQAEAVSGRLTDPRAVVILTGAGGAVLVVGDVADRALLPEMLRKALDAALRGAP